MGDGPILPHFRGVHLSRALVSRLHKPAPECGATRVATGRCAFSIAIIRNLSIFAHCATVSALQGAGMPASSTTEHAVDIGPKRFATAAHSETAVRRPVLAPPALAWRDLLTAAQTRALVIALLIGVSLAIRCFDLGAYGFSEDETNKLRAVASYRQLDLSANAEHPMVMKLAMFASMEAAGAWNAIAPGLHAPVISDEAALRLPNAIAGSLLTGVIFLLCELLFGLPTAIWAALFWALDVNAAALNRIGKEDTFLLLFLLVGTWFYERAKLQVGTDREGAQRWFARAGGAFGLMIASKYMPHYFGLHALYAAADGQPGQGPRKSRFFRAMGVAFLIANFALLLPPTWSYLAGYVHGDMQEHTGYFFAQQVRINNISATPFGTPIWFYVTALITKIPLVPLLLIALGLAQVAIRRRERGFIFLRVFLLFALVPYSLISSKFLRYMLPVFAILDIIAAVGVVWLLGFLWRLLEQRTAGNGSWTATWRPRIAMAAIVVASVLDPMSALVASAPFYSLHQNAVAARFFAPGSLFPDDEFYDAGVREAVGDIVRVAQPGAVIASDATKVVQVYLERAGRTDLRAQSLSGHGLPAGQAPEIWVLAQDAHTYFENQSTLQFIRSRSAPLREYHVGGGVAVQLFRYPQ
jgi:Dolichyl-phosphate-mannose-protein mannosyltransferase